MTCDPKSPINQESVGKDKSTFPLAISITTPLPQCVTATMTLITSRNESDEPPLDCEFDVFCGPPSSARTGTALTRNPIVKTSVSFEQHRLHFLHRRSPCSV